MGAVGDTLYNRDNRPLDTYTYLVEGHLSLDFSPLRNMVLSRYPAFYQHMLASPCTEVSVLAELFIIVIIILTLKMTKKYHIT